MHVLLPSRAVLYKRRTHRALRVPEILLIVFNYVTDDSGKPLLSSLAAIARTCRAFQRQAEEILWCKIPDISTLYPLLPSQVRNKKAWALSHRMLSGSQSHWTRFMDCASRVRVLAENTAGHDQDKQCSSTFLAMAALRDPPLLTPGLHKLTWKATHPFLGPAINLFIGPSLQSLEIDVKLLTNHVIRAPLGHTCPGLKHLKLIGNGRSAASVISRVLCTLHCLETVACSSLDNDAFAHLAQLKSLSYLAVDMRWSVLNLDTLRESLCPGSFCSLQMLYWKDYDLRSLTDIFLIPGISPSNIHLEIESFCTSPALRTFLHSFAMNFPYIHTFSLVHDVGASRRFGLVASAPGHEHQLAPGDLKPLFALKSLRVLNLVDLGHLCLNDDLVERIASAFPELEQLHLGTDVTGIPATITYDGLLSLLQRCPKLKSLGLSIDARDMLKLSDMGVRHEHVTHLRLQGKVIGSRRAEVDEMLRRVLPRLRTVEESLDGVIRCVRNVGTTGWRDSSVRTSTGSWQGIRTRSSLENAQSVSR